MKLTQRDHLPPRQLPRRRPRRARRGPVRDVLQNLVRRHPGSVEGHLPGERGAGPREQRPREAAGVAGRARGVQRVGVEADLEALLQHFRGDADAGADGGAGGGGEGLEAELGGGRGRGGGDGSDGCSRSACRRRCCGGSNGGARARAEPGRGQNHQRSLVGECAEPVREERTQRSRDDAAVEGPLVQHPLADDRGERRRRGRCRVCRQKSPPGAGLEARLERVQGEEGQRRGPGGDAPGERGPEQGSALLLAGAGPLCLGRSLLAERRRRRGGRSGGGCCRRRRSCWCRCCYRLRSQRGRSGLVQGGSTRDEGHDRGRVEPSGRRVEPAAAAGPGKVVVVVAAVSPPSGSSGSRLRRRRREQRHERTELRVRGGSVFPGAEGAKDSLGGLVGRSLWRFFGGGFKKNRKEKTLSLSLSLSSSLSLSFLPARTASARP